MLRDILASACFISIQCSTILIISGTYFLILKRKKLGLACITIGLTLILCGGFCFYYSHKIAFAEFNIQQTQEIAAVQEYETEGKIRGDRAWWVSLPTQQLEKKCRLIADKIGKSWEEIVKLLSSKNAIILFDPQPEKI
ncbi:MAG: hypothetical protein WC473_05415 [Patescibacteria group bacterium]